LSSILAMLHHPSSIEKREEMALPRPSPSIFVLLIFLRIFGRILSDPDLLSAIEISRHLDQAFALDLASVVRQDNNIFVRIIIT